MRKFTLSLLCLSFISFAWAARPLEWGILRHDWTYFNGNTNATSPLRNVDIVDIAVTNDGRLWLLTARALFEVQKMDNHFRLYQPLETTQAMRRNAQIFPNRQTGGLFLLTNETLWTTNDFETWLSEPIQPEPEIRDMGPHFTRASELLSLPDVFILSGFHNNVPGILFHSASDGHSFRFPAEDQMVRLRGSAFVDLHRATNRVLWMRDESRNGLWMLSRGNFELVANNIISITADDNGIIYVASTSSIYRINDRNELIRIQTVGARHLTADNNGSLWFVPTLGTNRLIRYNPTTNADVRLTAENSPIEGEIHRIIVSNDNTKYIWTQHGIFMINDSKPNWENWEVITAEFDSQEVFNANYWDTMIRLSDGTYTAFYWNDGRTRRIELQEGVWTYVKTYGRTRNFGETGNVFEKNGQLYFANRFGFFRVGDENIEQVEFWGRREFARQIRTVEVDKNGRIWFGTNGGAAKYENGNYTFFTRRNTSELRNETIVSMTADINGNLFAGTTNGLAVWNNGSWSFFDSRNGLGGRRVNAVASNSKGQTFVLATNMMYQTSTIDIYENGQITTETLPQRITGMSALVDAHDNLWINGHRELIRRSPDGEYTIFDASNSPLCRDLIIGDMFVFGDELRVTLRLPAHRQPRAATAPQRAERPAPRVGVTEERLSTFIPPMQVLIFDTTN